MEQRGTTNKSSDTPGRHQDLTNHLARLQVPMVVENGEERIRPDVMAFLMQAAQASHLARLRSLEESRLPVGSWSISITVSSRISVQPPEALISFSLINDGAASVYAEISTDRHEKYVPRAAPILSGETFTYDAIYPVIKSILLDVASGSAAVRIKGKTGRMTHQ